MPQRNLEIHEFYDSLGYCVASVLYANELAEGGIHSVIYDLRIDHHVSIKKFLQHFASRHLSKTVQLTYHRLRREQKRIKTITYTLRTWKWVKPLEYPNPFFDKESLHFLENHQKYEMERDTLQAIEFGNLYASYVVSGSYKHLAYNIIVGRIANLVTTKQYKIFFDTSMRITGMISWAWLSDEALMHAEGRDTFHLSQLIDGENFCIWDVEASPLATSQIISYIENEARVCESKIWIYRQIPGRVDTIVPYSKTLLAEEIGTSAIY